ncbi:MAG: apolipoprotein N-acyltransferase [Acidimicrobiia bacterium]|nr:apolipoprotein N-acyltransferase [Acidimicrobiia bacterium]
MMSVLLGAVGGLLLWAAFPPLGLGALVFVAPVPLLIGVRRATSGRQAALVGLVFGVAFFGPLLEWITEMGIIAWAPLVLVESLFPVAFAWMVFRARRGTDWQWMAVVVGGWSLTELARSYLPVGGFSWGWLGYAMSGFAGARGAARWIGVSGWTVLAMMVAGGLALRFHARRGAGWAAGAAIGAIVLLGAGSLWPAGADGERLQVALVQGNSPCPAERCADERQQITQSHLDLTRSLSAGIFDLVVWPESSTGYATDPTTNPEVAGRISAEAVRLGSYLLVGGDRPVDEAHFANVNLFIDPDGNIVGEYLKTHPVPFGEYIPWRSVFGWTQNFRAASRDMVRGEGPVVFPTEWGSLGSVISFEGAFARIMRGPVRDGAGLLVVATNNSSYGLGPASDQFIGMTRMHASALGVDVIHAALTGASTIITDNGTVGQVSGLFTAEILTGEVRVRSSGHTLYTTLGEWPYLLAILWLLVALVVPARNRTWRPISKHSVPSPKTDY